MAIIPDVPEEVEIHLQRNEFLTSKIIDQVADDDNVKTNEVSGDKTLVVEEYPENGDNYIAPNPLFERAMSSKKGIGR